MQDFTAVDKIWCPRYVIAPLHTTRHSALAWLSLLFFVLINATVLLSMVLFVLFFVLLSMFRGFRYGRPDVVVYIPF
jgi:hypothetical protein